MGKKRDAFLKALDKNKTWDYIGCSNYIRYSLADSENIPKSQRNDSDGLWAIKNNSRILDDTSKFEKLPANTKQIPGDILWYAYAHVAVNAGTNAIYESAPHDNHPLGDNGLQTDKFSGHNYNCAGVPLTCIYRIKETEDTEMAFTQKMIDDYVAHGISIANNDYHGYDNRVGYNLGADFGQRDYDCGAFVSECIRKVGLIAKGVVFEPNSPTGTWGYDTILTHAGFKKMTYNAKTVKKGDVLIKDGRHTELAIGDGKQVGAHNNYDGKPGDGAGNEISVVSLYTNYWDYMYRLPVGGSTPETPTTSHPVLQYGATGSEVKTLQTILNSKGFNLVVDGSFGPATLAAVKEYQKQNGLAVDGSVGPATWKSLETVVKPVEPTPSTKTLTPKERLEETLKVVKGEYGNNPERKNTLIKKHGEVEAQKIQDLVTLAYK